MENGTSPNEAAKTPQPVNKPEGNLFFNTFCADAAGLVLTAFSSIGTAVLMINKNFFRNAEREKRFDKINAKRDNLRMQPETTALRGQEWLHRIRSIENQHSKEIAAELKEMGITGITGPIEKFRSLRPNQKFEVFLTVGAVTAGAIGLISSIIGNRRTAEKEDELSTKLDEHFGGTAAQSQIAK